MCLFLRLHFITYLHIKYFSTRSDQLLLSGRIFAQLVSESGKVIGRLSIKRRQSFSI